MNAGSPPRRPSSGPARSPRRTPAAANRNGPVSSAPATAAPQTSETVPGDLVEVARITDAYGVQGWIRLASHEPAPDSVLCGARRCWIEHPQGTPPRICELSAIRTQGTSLVAHLPGCDDRDAALSFKGAVVYLSRAEFPAIAPDEYYWVDLVGCSVMSPDGAPLGSVTAVDDHGAHAILHVVDDAGEMLIPFVAAYIVSVDLAQRRIVSDWQRDW